jgi:Tol biopolymer transport system component
MVSFASDGTQGNSLDVIPAISADGRYVAFCSDSANLVEVNPFEPRVVGGEQAFRNKHDRS